MLINFRQSLPIIDVPYHITSWSCPDDCINAGTVQAALPLSLPFAGPSLLDSIDDHGCLQTVRESDGESREEEYGSQK